MFKAFKDKVTNEYEKAKVNIQSQALNLVNNGALANTTGENKLPGESPKTAHNASSSNLNEIKGDNDSIKSNDLQQFTEPGFSLVDLDEDNAPVPPRASSTPTPKVHSSSDNDSFFRTNFFSNMVSNFVPQSDIESEYESEASSRSAENVSKEQLVDLCYRLKERSKKYKERWGEVVKAYRTTIEERDKLKNVLAETQDRALRRVSELREQCNLEQEAKRHLEENLQVHIEEKEEQIKVLKTKLDLMNMQDKKEELIDLSANENEEQLKKVENLELLLAKSNESLKDFKEKLDSVTKENETLLLFKAQSEKLEKEVEYVKKLKESASSSFTESKQKLHDELESRSIIIKELKDQIEKRNAEIKHKNNELKNKNETLKTLNEKASKIEATFENEKSSLMEELSRGKAAAVSLLREEHEKQIQTINQEHEKIVQILTEENELLKEKTTKSAHTESTSAKEQERQLEEMRLSKEELEGRLAQTSEELNEAKAQLNDGRANFESKLENLQHKLVESEKLSQSQVAQLNELSDKILELDNLKEKLDTTEKLVNESKTESSQLSAELETIRDQLQQRDQAIEQMTADAKLLESQHSEQLTKVQQQLDQQSKPEPVDEGEIQELESKIETLKEKNRQKISRISELEKSIVSKDSEIIELSKTKSELENEIETFREKLQSASTDTEQGGNHLAEENEKTKRALEVTKKLMETLKEGNNTLSKEAKELRQCTDSLTQEKTQLATEVNDLSGELVSFKNKLIDIFYNAYAESEISDITSMDYGEFLTVVENSYKKLTTENGLLSQSIVQLEQSIQDAIANSEQDRSKQIKQLEELQNTNLSLIEEIEKLRKIEKQSKHTETIIEEKNAQLAALDEKVASLTAEVQEVREQLNSAKVQIKETNFNVVSKEDLLNQKSAELTFKDKELTLALERAASFDELSEQHKQTMHQLNEANKRSSQLEEDLRSGKGQLTNLGKQIEESNKQNASYLEEITKIKSNAKEILESKQKLQEKLKSTDGKVGALKNENQSLVDKNKHLLQQIDELRNNLKGHGQGQAQLELKIEELSKLVSEKESAESQLQQQLNDLKNKTESTSLNQTDLIKDLEMKLQTGNERCSELEEKLKSKENDEQELRTEVIALEEKLKLSSRTEKEMREDVRINSEVNSSLKEQVHKYLSEINELKNEMNALKGKHDLAIDKLYKQLEVRESQLDESLMNANSQHNSTVQDLIKSKSEMTKLNKLVEELTSANRDLESKLSSASETNEESLKKVTARYEQQIEALQSKLDSQKQEIAEKMDQFDNIESKFISEHKGVISQMENEISEKNTALEEVHEYYQQRLKAKDSELKHLHEQLTSTDKNNYQINALQNSILQYHEENSRLKELLNVRQEKNGDNGKNNNSDMENCAILGVHLPQPTEYEYLRNILFQFMTGREPVTLAKVIAAVMRFSNDQTDQIIRKQEALQTHAKFNNKPA